VADEPVAGFCSRAPLQPARRDDHSSRDAHLAIAALQQPTRVVINSAGFATICRRRVSLAETEKLSAGRASPHRP